MIHGGAVQITLGGVRGRGHEVDPAALWVNGLNAHDVRSFSRDGDRLAAIARDGVSMAPSFALTQPKKALAVIQPIEPAGVLSRSPALGHIHPGGILILENAFRRSGSRVGDENSRGVLQAIELPDGQAISILQPVHAEDVMVAWIARNLHPPRSAALRSDHTYTDRKSVV